MKCPRDGSELDLQEYWKHPRHVCKSCKGQLLGERDVLEALGRQDSGAFDKAAGARLEQLAESALACPRDGKRMRAIHHEGVELDICPACKSLWLDHGEYDKIRTLKKTPAANRESTATEGALDFGFDAALEFVGDAVGSIFDGL